MTISLSINSILALVYAQTALRYSMNRPDSTVLTADSRAAVRRLAIDAASRVCLALLPIIEDTNVTAEEITDPDSTEEILLFEIREGSDVNLPAMRLLAEHAISTHVLSEIYASTDSTAAQMFSDEAAQMFVRLRRMASCPRKSGLRPFP